MKRTLLLFFCVYLPLCIFTIDCGASSFSVHTGTVLSVTGIYQGKSGQGSVYDELDVAGLGTLKGGASASVQHLGVQVYAPSVPLAYDLGGYATANAWTEDFITFGGSPAFGHVTYHFDVTGSVTNPVVPLEYRTEPGNLNEIWSRVHVDLGSGNRWGETVYYCGRYNGSNTFIDRSFDITVPITFGESYWMSIDFTLTSNVWPGHYAHQVNFGETLTFFVSEITDDEGNILPLSLLESSSGIDYTVDPRAQQPIPEPATLLLLGSGLVGLAGLRRRFKKS